MATATLCLAAPLRAQDATPPDTSAPEPAVTEQIAALQKDNENLVEAIRSQRSGMERAIEDGNIQAQKEITSMHGTLRITAYAVSAIGAVGSILSLIILIKLAKASGAASEVHPHAAPTAPAPQSYGNPALTTALARIEERVNALAKAVQAPAKQQAPEPEGPSPIILGRLDAIENSLRELAKEKESKATAAPEANPVADSFWPKSMRAQENYPIWRKSLSDALASGQTEALQFASALLSYQTLFSRRNLTTETCGALLRELSLQLYNYCYALDTVTEEDRLDAASSLFRAVKDEVQLRQPSLEIKAFHPNDRLNTDAMEKVDSGNRLTVSKPLSWLIIDRTGGRERILHRAQVITG